MIKSLRTKEFIASQNIENKEKSHPCKGNRKITMHLRPKSTTAY